MSESDYKPEYKIGELVVLLPEALRKERHLTCFCDYEEDDLFEHGNVVRLVKPLKNDTPRWEGRTAAGAYSLFFNESDILGPAFHFNEEINVRWHDDKPWEMTRFADWRTATGEVLCADFSFWKRFRRIQPKPKPVIKKTCATCFCKCEIRSDVWLCGCRVPSRKVVVVIAADTCDYWQAVEVRP